MGQYLPWLADAARSTGLPVIELAGWRGHNHGPMADLIYGTGCHHTAGPDPRPGATHDFPSIEIVRNGRPGLPGPLSQLGLGWFGTIYVISDGLAYHGGEGSFRGVGGNSRYIGIEAEDAGDGDWSPAQFAAYPRLVAAIQKWLDRDAGWVWGHKEYAPGRKIDPAGIDMSRLRVDVARYLQGGTKEDDMADVPQDQWRAVHRAETIQLDHRSHHLKPVDDQLGHTLSTRNRVEGLAADVAAARKDIEHLRALIEERLPKE